MAEIGINTQQKQENRKIAADAVGSLVTIATAIAGGKAADSTENTEPPVSGPQQPGIEYLKCEKCGKNIPYKTGAVEITCPGCGEKYVDKDQAPGPAAAPAVRSTPASRPPVVIPPQNEA